MHFGLIKLTDTGYKWYKSFIILFTINKILTLKMVQEICCCDKMWLCVNGRLGIHTMAWANFKQDCLVWNGSIKLENWQYHLVIMSFSSVFSRGATMNPRVLYHRNSGLLLEVRMFKMHHCIIGYICGKTCLVPFIWWGVFFNVILYIGSHIGHKQLIPVVFYVKKY